MIRRLGPALLALALVAADLLRPSLEPGIPLFQATLTLLTMALVWRVFLRHLQAQGERWALLTLVILCALLYLRHPRSLDADGVHYFTFARSLIADRDLALSNDYELLGQEMHAPNVLPIGAPLVWSILLIPLYAFQSLLGVLFGFTVTGADPMFIAAACLVSIVLGCTGVFLLYGEIRRHASPLPALLTVLLVWFGSPLRFYMRVLPSFAHAIEFFAGVLVLVASRRLREEGSRSFAVKAGLACGLVYLVRSQDGLLLLVPAIFVIDSWFAHRKIDRLIEEGALVLAGFVALAWIQSAVWWSMFGTPFLVPHKLLHGEAFAQVSTPKLLEMLLSDRGGLFSTYPVTMLAVCGLPFALRKSRPWAIAAVIVLVLQWRVNASIFDWYQVRRFTGTIPLIAIGLTVITPAIARAGVLAVSLLVLLVHQYDVAIDSLRPLPGTPVAVQAALRETADSIAAPVYGGLEAISPKVAVAFLEGYTGSSLLLAGRSDLDLAREQWWMRLPRLSRRFSDVEVEDGSLCRFVEGREARFWLPLRGSGELRISFEVRAMETETPQKFEVLVNGRSLGEQEIAPAWQTVRFVIPQTAWHEGTNEIVLKFEQAPLFFKVRGYGARAYRAAAIRLITFHGGAFRPGLPGLLGNLGPSGFVSPPRRRPLTGDSSMRKASLTLASLFLAGNLASAETTRTLKAELSADPSRPFRVENLAGRMVVRQGTGTKVVVTATVHGEDAKTADLLRLSEVRDSKTGLPTLRVQYPLSEYTSYRYGRDNGGGGGFFERMFSGHSNATYDGTRVTVSGGRGLGLYADLVVEIPRGASGTFRNVVGNLEGSNVEGTLKFDSGSGDISLRDFKGDIVADTGSGDVLATSGHGSFKCNTGSGDCMLKSFEGERIDLDTGSGDINVTDSTGRFVTADTGSGTVELEVEGSEEIKAETGSGDVTVEASGSKLSRISADTGSGDVSVKLPRTTGFEMMTDVGSGDVTSDFDDATAIMQRRKVKGYRRGDLKVKIDVDTGSGDVSVGPGRS